MDRVDRRTFLKRAAVVSAATATSSALPGAAAGTGAPALPTQSRVVWKKAPCRLCEVGCGLLIGSAAGRAVAVRGDSDSLASLGLACVKGYHATEALYGSDRITRAMVRQGGTLVPVRLSEALDLVARNIRETIQRHGRNSVALYGSAQWSILDAYVASKLVKGGLGTSNIETSARLRGGSSTAALGRSFGSGSSLGCYEDIEAADTFVLWGINLAESHPVLFSRMLEHRKRHPAVRIVDLGFRTTRTSYVADQQLLLSPRSVAAVANGICRELVERKLVRREFVDRYVAFRQSHLRTPPEGGPEPAEEMNDASWAEYVAYLSPYSPIRVEQLSGLAAASIRWLASLYGDPARKVVSIWDRGLSAGGDGTAAATLLHNIHLLTGKVATPGNNPLCLTAQPSGGGTVYDAGTSGSTLPRGVITSEDDRRRAAGIWDVPLDRLDPSPGPPALAMFEALDRGEIRFLWIQGSNPLSSLPDSNRWRRAAGRNDRFIVVSEAYPTTTSDVADVILPAALWLEREGIMAGADRRLTHWSGIVAPPGEAAPDAWLMIEVARRLGLENLFPYDRSRWVDQVWEEYSRFFADSATQLPSLDLLRGRGSVTWPFVDGREVRWRYHTPHDPSADEARGEYDFQGNPDHRARVWLHAPAPSRDVPDQHYPFTLHAGAVLEHWGGGALTRRIPTLHEALPHAYVELNRIDARELGVRNRGRVRLVSRRGALEIQARIEYRSQPPRGMVFVPSFDQDHPVNRLMSDQVDPLSGEPGGLCAVRIEPVSS